MRSFKKNFDLKNVEYWLYDISENLKEEKSINFKSLSNYGLYLVQAGKVQEALILFEKLAELHPNEYSIISNLGTTYELSGQNEKALEYIKKGIKINPSSHKGSEWIHVKILEAKIALEKDPAYLEKHSVLNLNAQQKKSQKVFDQLYIQLQERFPFSPAEQNPVMADLFVELGDYYFEIVSYEYAKAFYQIAKLYFKSARKDIDKKIDNARKLRTKYSDKHPKRSKKAIVNEGKVTGVAYQSLIYDPSEGYSINWSSVETDPEKLLSYLNRKQINEEIKKNEFRKKNQSVGKTKKAETMKNPDKSMLWIGLTLAILIIAIFTYFRAKKK